MALINAVYATIEISKVMIPPIFLGFFVASVVRSSSYFRYLSLPTSRLASVANLPVECSAALTLYIMNNWAALAMLSELHKKEIINDNDLIVAILIGFIPKGFHAIFFSVPVTVSVLGLHTGALYTFLELLGNVFVAVVGIFIGRLILMHRESPIFDVNVQEETKKVKINIKTSLNESTLSSIRIIKILIPTIFLAQLAIDYILVLPIAEKYNSFIEPFGVPPSSLIVLLASSVSQNAALVAGGTLLDSGDISVKSCLLLLFMARFLHLGIGFLRIGVPSRLSYFSGSIGLKVAIIEYLLIEVANIMLIFIIFINL